MYSLVILALLGLSAMATTVAGDKLPLMGVCSKKDLKPDESVAGLEKLLKINDGIWSYVLVPKIDAYEKAEYSFVDIDATDKKGIYLLTTFIKFPKEAPIQLARQLATGTKKGVFDAKASVLFTKDTKPQVVDFDIVLLKYKPGQWAFFYECSKNGGNSAVDFRYVIAQKPLSKEDLEEIKKIDEASKFKGELIPLKV